MEPKSIAVPRQLARWKSAGYLQIELIKAAKHAKRNRDWTEISENPAEEIVRQATEITLELAGLTAVLPIEKLQALAKSPAKEIYIVRPCRDPKIALRAGQGLVIMGLVRPEIHLSIRWEVFSYPLRYRITSIYAMVNEAISLVYGAIDCFTAQEVDFIEYKPRR